MLSLYFLMTYFSLCTHISVSTGCRHDHLTQVVLNIAFHLLNHFPMQIHSQVWMVSVLPQTGWIEELFELRISHVLGQRIWLAGNFRLQLPYSSSAAFDMVDHQILLERLETSCGISSLPLLWIKSYLSDRTQMIVSGESRTSWVPIFLGVPQGSVLG